MITFRKIIRLDVKVSVVAVWVGYSAPAARPEYDTACWPNGPSWNSLPDFIRDPTSSTDCFRRLFKTYLFARYYCIQRIRGS